MSAVQRQVCVQLPTSADNVTLLVFAADRRRAVRRAAAAAAPLLRLSGPPTLRSISCVPGKTIERVVTCPVTGSTCYNLQVSSGQFRKLVYPILRIKIPLFIHCT